MSGSTVRRLTAELLKELNARVTGNCILTKPGELESALHRPENLAHYVPTSSQADRAASLGFGLIANHPFFDGNKRTAHLAVNEWLKAHGLRELPSDNSSLAQKIFEAHKAIAAKNGDSQDEKLQKNLSQLYARAIGK